jgi:hypothetical protein
MQPDETKWTQKGKKWDSSYEGWKSESWTHSHDTEWTQKDKKWKGGSSGMDLDASASAASASASAAVVDRVRIDPEQPFDGAGGHAIDADATRLLHMCGFCKDAYPVASWIAYVKVEEPHDFMEIGDTVMQKALSTIHKEDTVPINQFQTGQHIRPICAKCKGGLDGKVRDYIKNGKVTALWLRKARASKGRGQGIAHAEFILKMHEDRIGEECAVKASKVYETMLASKRVRAANDFVYELGAHDNPFLWVVYTCTDDKCLVAPTKSNNWLRCRRNQHDDTEDMETDGQKFGYWLCGVCIEPWAWRKGASKRLVILGEATEEKGFSSYKYGYFGEQDNTIDAKVAFLQTARILKTVGDEPLTTKRLMDCIETINCSVEKKFAKGVKEVRMVQGREVSQADLDYRNIRLVCSHPSLSMVATGKAIQVIDLKLCDKTIEPLTKKEFNFYLDVCASALNIEDMWPKAPTHKVAKQSILESEGFALGRTFLAKASL